MIRTHPSRPPLSPTKQHTAHPDARTIGEKVCGKQGFGERLVKKIPTSHAGTNGPD